jgi:hypothetical protein
MSQKSLLKQTYREVSAGWLDETSTYGLEYFVELFQSVGETQLETNEPRQSRQQRTPLAHHVCV